MEKRLIVPTAAIACVALCAALWPQTAPVEEAPTVTDSIAVTAPLPTAQPRIQPSALPTPAEEEKAESHKVQSSNELTVQPKEPIPEPVPEPEAITPTTSKPEKTEPSSSAIATPPVPDDLPQPQYTGEFYYVPGFGWLESQGAGECIYDTQIYENGNKVGIMD